MRASIVDLRRKTAEILRALDRGERVTIVCRGKVKGTIVPASAKNAAKVRVEDHPAFGMWEDREDMQDVEAYMGQLRKGRADAL